MIKRIALIALVLVMCFNLIPAGAEETDNSEASGNTNISQAITSVVYSLALEAQHYFNTQIDTAPMTVSRPSEKLYVIKHTTDTGKIIETQLYNTPWGTWNLGDLSMWEGNSEKVIIGGGTDWEYVFRIFNPITQNLEFTGGNHGSEVFKSLVMKDGVTGEAFEINVGEEKTVSRLVVEEETTILLGNVDYLPYADVKRTYVIVGDTVNLDCDIVFTRDVKMALSYTTMACVNKDFSRYCFFDNEAYVTTNEKGSFSNKHLGNMPSAICHLSGDDLSASVTVGIYNTNDMTDDFSNKEKTFIWDMTSEFNKLYFSKYDMTTLTKITAGTVWDFGSFWQINIG